MADPFSYHTTYFDRFFGLQNHLACKICWPALTVYWWGLWTEKKYVDDSKTRLYWYLIDPVKTGLFYKHLRHWLIKSPTAPFPPNLQNIINPKPLKIGTWNFKRWFTSLHWSPVMCHMSCVMCHMSHAMCHMSHKKNKKNKKGWS